MYEVLVPALVGPGLVAASTVAARRWGMRVGGVVSALPAIVGPVLLIDAERHGGAFAAQAATGTLLGLAALSAFALIYGRLAVRRSWPWCLTGAWLAAAGVGAVVQGIHVDLTMAVLVAVTGLALAYAGLPAVRGGPPDADRPPLELGLRMLLTAVLILALPVAAGWLGPQAGGVLAALPVLACVLATFVHASHGGPAAVQLLRGMLTGMAGFVVFCVVVAGLLPSLGVGATFALATGATLLTQALVLRTPTGARRTTR